MESQEFLIFLHVHYKQPMNLVYVVSITTNQTYHCQND
jgi:hypothetical protein